MESSHCRNTYFRWRASTRLNRSGDGRTQPYLSKTAGRPSSAYGGPCRIVRKIFCFRTSSLDGPLFL